MAGEDTWVRWRLDWDATPGDHVLRVRANDIAGLTQTGEIAEPAPDGATGWDARRVACAEPPTTNHEWSTTMTRRRRILALSFAIAAAAAACGDDDEAATTATTVPSTSDTMADETMADETMDDETMDDGAMAELPAWQTMTITDVDGATFTLDDFHGTPVLVETFATWCPNCREQLQDTNALAAAAGDDVQVIALSIETDLSPDEVRAYAEDNGFDDVRFAVMTPELLAALVDAYGNTVVNAPSTPKLVIDTMGHAGELSTGSASVEELATQLGLDL